jgi:hypothetical protein
MKWARVRRGPTRRGFVAVNSKISGRIRRFAWRLGGWIGSETWKRRVRGPGARLKAAGIDGARGPDGACTAIAWTSRWRLRNEISLEACDPEHPVRCSALEPSPWNRALRIVPLETLPAKCWEAGADHAELNDVPSQRELP